MRSDDQRAYDRGSTIFSPDGRLYQVEYARAAVERGSPCVGVATGGGIVLASRTRRRSPLADPETVRKLHPVDDHLAIASAGNAADARRLVDRARRLAQRERLRYDQPIGVAALATAVADHVQEYTQSGGQRPYGAGLIVGGVDDDGPALFEVDPSGTPYGFDAIAIGGGQDDAMDRLEAGYDGSMDLEAGIDLAIDGLANGDEGLAPATVDVATVPCDDRGVEELDDEAVAERLDAREE